MNKKIKNVLYWITVIPAIIDIIKGVVTGVKKGLKDIKEKKDKEQNEAFEKANRGEQDN